MKHDHQLYKKSDHLDISCCDRVADNTLKCGCFAKNKQLQHTMYNYFEHSIIRDESIVAFLHHYLVPKYFIQTSKIKDHLSGAWGEHIYIYTTWNKYKIPFNVLRKVQYSW